MEWLCPGIIVVVVILLIAGSIEQGKQRAAAKADYERSLEALKRNPTNADLRQRTLELGRTYSNRTRNQSGVTVYDEVALANDIGAACAAAAAPATGQPSTPGVKTVEERLQDLGRLRNRNLITDEEYSSRRRQILEEI